MPGSSLFGFEFECSTDNAHSAARLRGFEKDLNLQGQEFATLLSILYVGYILMQVPSYMLTLHLAIYED